VELDHEAPAVVDGCETCSLLQRRDRGEAPAWDRIVRTSFWDVVHSYDTSLEGWLVLVVRRHLTALADLSGDESLDVGRLIRRVSAALHEVLGCPKTYVAQFAESPAHQHVHVHVIPRPSDLSAEARGPGIFRFAGVETEARVTEERMNDITYQLRRVLGDLEEFQAQVR